MIDVNKVLQECPILSGLPEQGIAEAVAIAKVRHFEEKALIYDKGDRHSALSVIAEGAVRINSVSATGQEATLMIFEAGTWFGDNVFSPGMARVYGATAHSNVTLIELPGDKFRQLLSKYPENYAVALDLLSRRLWSAISVIEDDALRGMEARIGRRLLLLAEYQRGQSLGDLPFSVRVTREHIANMMGMTRQGVHKMLKQFEQAGLLKLEYGRVTVLNPEVMDHYVRKLE